MFRSTRGRSVPAALAICLCAALVGPVGTAQASDQSIVKTLQRFNTKIGRDERAVAKGLGAYKQGRARPVVTALRHEVSDIGELRKQLDADQPSTAKGKRAKKDILQGLGLIEVAYAALAKDFQAATASHPVTKSKVSGAIKVDKSGRKEFLAGLQLLL